MTGAARHPVCRALAPAAALLALLFAAAPLAAHEFAVTLIVPPGTEAESRAAFLLASSERDGHPNETSDGHLGGVDSQLSLVTPGSSLPRADIVVAIAPARLPAGTGAASWAFTLERIGPRARAEFLSGDFVTRFVRRHGTPPGEAARRTYVAARLIDIAVRAHDGVADAAAMEAAIAPY